MRVGSLPARVVLYAKIEKIRKNLLIVAKLAKKVVTLHKNFELWNRQ